MKVVAATARAAMAFGANGLPPASCMPMNKRSVILIWSSAVSVRSAGTSKNDPILARHTRST